MLGIFIALIKKNLLLSIFIFVAIFLTILLFFSEIFKKELILTRTFPPAGKIVEMSSTFPLFFYFPENIDQKSIKITVVPETKTTFNIEQVSQDEFFIEVFPDPWWKFNQNYVLTIDRELRSVGGAKLINNISYKFTVVPPPVEQMPPQTGSEEGIDYRNFR